MRTRGREFPGNYNYALLSELFHEQSSRWQSIAEGHVAKVNQVVTAFVEMALLRLICEDNVRREVSVFTSSGLDEGAGLRARSFGRSLQTRSYNRLRITTTILIIYRRRARTR
jgi:hypothetical protein